MQNELEKIDILRERMGVSYREAKEALEESGGDLIKALIRVEESKEWGWSDNLWEKGREIVGQMRTYISKGNQTKVKLRRGGKTIAEFPASIGVLGILAALASTELAVVTGIGAAAAVVNKVSLEIEKPGGETKVISLDRRREE